MRSETDPDRVDGWRAIVKIVGYGYEWCRSMALRAEHPLPVTKGGHGFGAHASRAALLAWMEEEGERRGRPLFPQEQRYAQPTYAVGVSITAARAVYRLAKQWGCTVEEVLAGWLDLAEESPELELAMFERRRIPVSESFYEAYVYRWTRQHKVPTRILFDDVVSRALDAAGAP